MADELISRGILLRTSYILKALAAQKLHAGKKIKLTMQGYRALIGFKSVPEQELLAKGMDLVAEQLTNRIQKLEAKLARVPKKASNRRFLKEQWRPFWLVME